MQKHAWFHGGLTVVGTLAFCLWGTVARAQSVTTERQTVNPAPAAATTVVQAPAAQPAAPAPAPGPTTTTNKSVTTDTHSDNFMGTIAKNTLYGAVAGGLVGGAVYFLARDTFSPMTVAYWGAGGALVGAAVGIVEVSTRESRNERAVASVLGGKRAEIAFVPRLVDVRF